MLIISPVARLFSLTALAVAVFYVSSVATNATADTLLRFKFKVGDKLDYEWRRNFNHSMVDEDKTISTNSKEQRTCMFSQEVKSVDADGKATVEVKINRVKKSATCDSVKTMEYDSAKETQQGEEAKMLADHFGQILHKPFEIKIDAQGNYSDIEMPEALKWSIGTTRPLICFPKEAVTPGKTWTVTVDLLIFGMGKQTFKYAGSEAKCGKDLEKIELPPTIITNPDEGPPTGRMITERRHEIKADILFDNKAGRLQNAKIIRKGSFDQEWMGRTLKTTNEWIIEVKLLPKTGAK